MASFVNDQSFEEEEIQIPVNVDFGEGPEVRTQPVCFGVPLPQGTRLSAGRLRDGNGGCASVQLEPLSRWPDKSVQWMLVDAILPVGYSPGPSTLELGDAETHFSNEPTPSPKQAILVHESENQIAIETGTALFQIDRKTLRPLEQVSLNGIEILGASGMRLVVTDSSGEKFEAECDGWRVETAGSIRATITGSASFPQLKSLRATIRLNFYAGSGLLLLDVAVHNPNRAQHPGGLWDLGDSGSLLFQDLSIEVEFAKGASKNEVRCKVEPGFPASAIQDQSWNLYQDSSGGENWNCVNHVNREAKVTTNFQGYRSKSGTETTTGLRAEPVFDLSTSQGRTAFGTPNFWQQFPKAISVTQDKVRIGLFPHEYGDLHELQGGERKTHTVWVDFKTGESNLDELDWIHHPAKVQPTAKWCDSTGCIPQLEIDECQRLSDFDSLLSEAVGSDKGILAQRERVDEYGWRNFGEIFADHEEAYYEGSQPLISHYNNQYDMIHGFLLQSLRTGKSSWFKLGDDLAKHVVDIDLYHTTQDKAAYNGGLFWLTDHYVHAHTATHRTYSKHNCPANGMYGGGPGAEHNFTSGLLLHYFLTGNSNSKAAVQQLANWVVAMDDGCRTVFGIVDDSFTGLATGGDTYHGPNRGGGFSINSLLDAWVLTHQDEYLLTAERLIRRCIHPHDDINKNDLLNVEARWSYTVFLSSVLKYLNLKARAGDLDRMYAYAQASVIHYAKWMLENELPYFDQIEKLEYPTEAWAVQEFRKANVLRLAAAHTEGDLRHSLLQRGKEFSDRAWQDLLRFETRTNARSLAVMMIEGMTDCRLRENAVPPAPQADASLYGDFGTPEQFVSQKQRVKSQLRQPVGIAKAVASTLNPLRWQRYWRIKNKAT